MRFVLLALAGLVLFGALAIYARDLAAARQGLPPPGPDWAYSIAGIAPITAGFCIAGAALLFKIEGRKHPSKSFLRRFGWVFLFGALGLAIGAICAPYLPLNQGGDGYGWVLVAVLPLAYQATGMLAVAAFVAFLVDMTLFHTRK